MSFAEELRQELTELSVKRPCCRRALLMGMLLSAGECERDLVITLSDKPAAELAAALIKGLYGKEPLLNMIRKYAHTYYELSFFSPPAHKTLKAIKESGITEDSLFRFLCEHCRGAFLRGAFLAGGTMSDPDKSLHLEFLLPKDGMSLFSSVLSQMGLSQKTVVRPHGIGFYYKGGDDLQAVLAHIGAHHLTNKLYDSQIARQIRNDENRATNCVARNIEKSIAASQKQMEAIGVLKDSGKFDGLPQPLRVSAELRLEYPDAALEELTALHEPPISKSGLNHRLQKLCELAEKERKK